MSSCSDGSTGSLNAECSHSAVLQSFMTGCWSPCQYIRGHQKGQAQGRESLAPLELVTSAAHSAPLLAQVEAPPLNDCSWSLFLSGSFPCEPSGPEVVI